MTKFCCFRYLEEIDRAEVKQRIERACERLQVSKLPLVQFFWSNYDVKRYVDVALMLTELKEEGLIQEIGATNFDLKHLMELKRAGVPIISSQVQLSALDRRPVQSGMADWCAENGVSLIGFGTVGSGILSNEYLGRKPPAPEERNTASMRMYSATASRFGDWKLVQELLRTMDAVAANVRSDGRCAEANISNVAQRYVLDTPAVASVLIGVRNQEHLAENVRTHAFQLKQDERDEIDKVVAKRKGPAGDVWDIERGYA
jgi:aryl-alcohol dehydrogenase-like predicted oxidoreductase